MIKNLRSIFSIALLFVLMGGAGGCAGGAGSTGGLNGTPQHGEAPPAIARFTEDHVTRWSSIPLLEPWFFSPGATALDTALPPVPLEVPGSWNTAYPHGEPYGVGVYRILVEIPPHRKELGLLIPDQAIAYHCSLDGDLVAASGFPGESPAATRVVRESHLVPLGTGPRRFELVCTVANYHYNVGGMINAPRIGEYRYLAILRDGKMLFTGLFAGALLMITLYYLLLYAQHRSTSPARGHREALLFALFCGFVLVRVITVSHLPERLFDTSRAFEVSIRLEFISLYGAVPVYVALLAALFTLPRSTVVIRITGFFAAAASVLVAVLPVHLSTQLTLVPFQMLTVATSVYVLAGLFLSGRRGEPGAAILLGGFALFFLIIINDILHAMLLIRTAHLMPMGMLFFVMAHFVVLTNRHAGAEAKTRDLAAELARERDSLDQRVQQRTTELELANSELRREEEARLEFVATISHELRTPLTLITTPLDQATRGKYGAELAVDGSVVQSIRRNAQRIETLIENLLDYSRFELGRLVPQFAPVALAGAVTALTGELKPVAEEKDLQLEFRNQLAGECWIDGDLRLLELAFFNLVSNALKFTPAGGRVTVALEEGPRDSDPAGTTVHLQVTDTGVGIPEEDMPRIFEKYYRGCVEVDGSRPGSGIGLPLSRTIVDLHQGELHVQSTPGVGSTFTIALQKAAHHDLPEAPGHGLLGAPSSTRAANGSGGAGGAAASAGHTILVVEDNRELREYITDALGGEFNVTSAADGTEALKMIRGAPTPDLVISDIMMPRMDGAELFAMVRRDGHYTDLPFLFLTARTDTRLEKQLRHDGAVDYIRKPFDMETLQLKVRSLVQLRSSVRVRTENEYARRLTDFLGLPGGKHRDPAGAPESPPPTVAGLTERERQICTLLARGMTDKEIGAELGISGRTVSNMLTRVYRTCGVANRTELTALVSRHRDGV